MTFRVHFLLALVVLLFTAACGAGNLPPTPTLPPLATATPRSTPLPDVPTAISAGYDEENPLQIVIVPADREAAEPLVEQLQAELSERSGLSVTIKLAESEAEAAGDLCASDRLAAGANGEDSERRYVSAVWVSGMTAAVASSAGCGVPVLQLNTGTADEPDTGLSGVLLLNAELESAGIAAVEGRTFCRTSYTDFFSWTVPLLILRAEGIDVTDTGDLEDIDEYDSYEELVAAISSGDCAAGGMPLATWESILEEDETLAETVVVAEVESVEFPYAMLVFPFAASLDVINPVVDALLEMDYTFGRAEAPAAEATPDPEATVEATAESEPDTAETEAETTDSEEETEESAEDSDAGQMSLLAPFFGDGIFQRHSDTEFAALLSFLQESGISFQELSD